MCGCDEQHSMIQNVRVKFYSGASRNKRVLLQGLCLCHYMKIRSVTIPLPDCQLLYNKINTIQIISEIKKYNMKNRPQF